MKICITSLLGKRHADALEQLLYFHPQQSRFREDIIASVERYGSPRIVESNGGLRIQLELLGDVQSLYAMAERGKTRRLVGAVVYTRASGGVLEVLHIVVKDEFTIQGRNAKNEVTAILIEEVCRIARQIQGVHSVRLAYDRGSIVVKPSQDPDGIADTVV